MSKSDGRRRFRGLAVAAIVGAALAFAAPALANPCPGGAADHFFLLTGSSFTSGEHQLTIGTTTVTLTLTKHPATGAATSVDFTVGDTSASENWGVARAYTNPAGASEKVYDYTPPSFASTGLTASGTGNAVTGFKACLSTSGVAAVRFRSASATLSARTLTVQWRTLSEGGIAAYNVYGVARGKRVRLNARVIASDPGGASGYSFRYRLPRGMAAPTGVWIEAISLDGLRLWKAVSVRKR